MPNRKRSQQEEDSVGRGRLRLKSVERSPETETASILTEEERLLKNVRLEAVMKDNQNAWNIFVKNLVSKDLRMILQVEHNVSMSLSKKHHVWHVCLLQFTSPD